MAIAPLSIPQLGAVSGGADFSSLANLGNVYQKAQQDQLRKQTLADLSSGRATPQEIVQAGVRLGDMNLANLGQSAINRQSDDAWRREEAARSQRNADRSYGLQERQFRENQDYSPEERAQLAIKHGIDPRSAQGRAWILTGKLPDDANSLPSGFQRDPATGGLAPIPGGPADPSYLRQKGDRQNAPSGYQWIDPNNPSAGMVAIPGGPAEKTDAEVAGRLGLAKSFLGELPDIKKRVEAGEITGPIDATKAYMGVGGPGEIRRKIDSGAESLLRMLTGAGMNKEEAAEYTRRYKFHPTDSSATLLSKLDQLDRELNSVGETVGRGRGGWNPPSATKPSGTTRLKFNPATGTLE